MLVWWRIDFNFHADIVGAHIWIQEENAEDGFPNASVAVYNLLGERVLQSVVSGPSKSLDVCDLLPGLYFMDLRSSGKSALLKFLKQ